jgi:hypothetical protein
VAAPAQGAARCSSCFAATTVLIDSLLLKGCVASLNVFYSNFIFRKRTFNNTLDEKRFKRRKKAHDKKEKCSFA